MSKQRDIKTQNELTASESYIQRQSGVSSVSTKRRCSIKKFLLETFPIADWIQEYQFKRDFPMDLIAGLTVTILQIPQGIAYGYLANVPSVCGLYTAFFTSFIYVIFGTSRHLNIGTFAVVCLMVGQTVTTHSSLDQYGEELKNHPDISVTGGTYRDIEVLSAITFIVSLYLLSMYILRLGLITAILSQTLVNAFTSACAVQLVSSQIKDILGLTINRRPHDYFKIGFDLYDVFDNIKQMNYVALSMASVTLVILVFYKECIKDRLAKKCSVPIPVELIVMSASTAASYFLELNQKYQVPIIGQIPTGLPKPMVPNMDILKHVAFDSFPIAMVSYIITISFGFIFARKGSYEINPNQEFLALGLMNLMGCFFLCIPVSASASRTVVQYNVGMVSQFTTLISTIILLFVLLYIGPVLEYSPKSVLAAIIISAVYGMLCEIGDIKNFWLLSKLDAFIWIVTFGGTILVEIKYGLLMGIAAALLVIFYHFCNPHSYLLGSVAGTELYLPKHRYKEVKEMKGLRIFHFEGGINFATKGIYKKHLAERTEINAKQIIIDRKKAFRKLKPGQELPKIEIPEVYCIILDFSAITHVDPAGMKTLKNIVRDYEEVGCPVLICSLSDTIYAKLENYDYVTKVQDPFTVFLSIHDAVLYAKQYIIQNKKT